MKINIDLNNLRASKKKAPTQQHHTRHKPNIIYMSALDSSNSTGNESITTQHLELNQTKINRCTQSSRIGIKKPRQYGVNKGGFKNKVQNKKHVTS